MAKPAKCVTCNVVIDELLTFIQNKATVADEASLMRICAAAYTSEQIRKSNSLLLDYLPTDVSNTVPSAKCKKNRVLANIIGVFKETNPDLLPVFVAKDLEKLPPITVYNLDVSKLLKDLTLVQTELNNIKSTYVTKEQLEAAKMDCLSSFASNMTLKGETQSDSIQCIKKNEVASKSDKKPHWDNITDTRTKCSVNPTANIDESSVTAARVCAADMFATYPRRPSFSGAQPREIAQSQSHMTATTVQGSDGFTLVQYKNKYRNVRAVGAMGGVIVETKERNRAPDRQLGSFIYKKHT